VAEPTAPPLLRVVRGEPTAEELAALTVVVAALSRQRRPRRRPTPVGAWASRADVVRTPLQPGPGGWRAAGRFA
jgi:acyl-CoA carboxylase epsilon subunit